MKIAILTSGFLPVVDGVTVTVWHRVKGLSDRGHQVRLFCPDYEPLATLYPNWKDFVGEIFPGVRVIPLPSTPFMGIAFERNISAQAYPQLLQELEAFQPDLIHVDEPDRLLLGFDRVPAVDYARAHQIPCVGFFHTDFLGYMEDYLPLPKVLVAPLQAIAKRFITQKSFNAYDVTLVSSAATYRKVQAIGITNAVQGEFLGIDLSRFSPELRQPQFWQQQYGLPDLSQKIKLAFLGRLTPDKGWDFTLKAFSKLAKRRDCSDLALLIAGDGGLRSPIQHHFQKLGISAYFLGRISPDQVPAFFANSDLHLTTSQRETRGLTVLEAFAAGLPVLAPSAGGVVDSIRDRQNGLLFPPNDIPIFLTQLETLLDQPELRQKLGAQAQQEAQAYGLDAAIDRLIALWQEYLHSPDTKKRLANP